MDSISSSPSKNEDKETTAYVDENGVAYVTFRFSDEKWLHEEKKVRGQKNNTIIEVNFDEKLTSENTDGPDGAFHEMETIKRYEKGIYATLRRQDFENQIERVRFSRNIFTEEEAKVWWFNNGEKVCREYDATATKWAQVEDDTESID